jgi:hypothetical protein
MSIRNDGPDDVEAVRQLKGFAYQLLLSQPPMEIGPHELSPCLVPGSTASVATMNARMRPCRDDHRPIVNVDAMRPEPFAELVRLRKQVMLAQRAIKPWEGREETVAVAKVKVIRGRALS